MKFNLSQPLIDHTGKALFESGPEGTPPTLITLGLSLERAAVYGGQAQDDGTKKYEQFKLAQLMARGGEVELESAQITAFKELAARVYNAVGYGAVVDALEGRVQTGIVSLADLPVDKAQPGDIDDLLAGHGLEVASPTAA